MMMSDSLIIDYRRMPTQIFNQRFKRLTNFCYDRLEHP